MFENILNFVFAKNNCKQRCLYVYDIVNTKNKNIMKSLAHSQRFLFPLIFLSILISKSLAQTNEIDILFQQKIPMRDGVHLSANIYKPAQMNSPLPVILMITPYVSNYNPEYGPYYAMRGFIYVYVDTRGRGNSKGEFAPFENDGKDGYDVVEWLAKQPWCNGKVGMMGSSYRGMVQWFTLKEFPPGLYSIAPTASVGPAIDFPRRNNIYRTYAVQWLGLVQGNTHNVKFFESYHWHVKNSKVFKEYIPFSKIDSVTGIDRTIFQKWIKHPTYDEYWENMVPKQNDYAKMNIPVLTVTGYFDGDQPGALHYYNNHLRYASDNAKNMHYIVIGPWDHFGTIFPASETGGLKFGKNAVIDIKKMHLDWFNWTLKNLEKPEFFKDNAYFYVMGTNEWKYAGSLENISNESIAYYLSSHNGQANDVFHSGTLLKTIDDKHLPDTIVYDPIKDEAVYNSSGKYYTDQSEAFRKEKLIYHTPPLKEDLTIAGNIKVNLYLQINTPDCDFQYKIYEIKPNGESLFLTEDCMRARYRESLKTEKLLNPDDINLYEFNSRFFIVRKISKGSRLRFVFGALNSTAYQRNYNSGGDVSFETSKDAQTAIIRLFHNEEYPSNIMLPILKNDL